MKRTAAIVLVLGMLTGCQMGHTATSQKAMNLGKPIVFFNITTNPMVDAHPVTMALQLANHALDDDRHVVLFFNVKSVGVPTKQLPLTVRNAEARPVRDLLADAIANGADVHVCPMCLKAMGVNEGDLVDGAHVTSRDALFSTIGPNTVVFTY